MSVRTFDNMIGKVMKSVTNGGDTMVFTAEDGSTFTFYHAQDCCESVSIEDVAGDLDDLVGSPLVQAEEVSNLDGFEEPDPSSYESCTWTFYKYATTKGSVTVRWLGTSNGYYGEGVDYNEELAKTEG